MFWEEFEEEDWKVNIIKKNMLYTYMQFPKNKFKILLLKCNHVWLLWVGIFIQVLTLAKQVLRSTAPSAQHNGHFGVDGFTFLHPVLIASRLLESHN